ncbi:MAG: hypothetical protein ACE5H1_08010 [Thermodesulfobacteriota bacterium]
MRKYTTESKSIWVAEEHSDEFVVALIGASIASLSVLGKYIGTDQHTLRKYYLIDWLYQKEPDSAVEQLISDEELLHKICLDLLSTGYKLIEEGSEEELQIKYLAGIGSKATSEMNRRISAYSTDLFWAKQEPITIDQELLLSSQQKRTDQIL